MPANQQQQQDEEAAAVVVDQEALVNGRWEDEEDDLQPLNQTIFTMFAEFFRKVFDTLIGGVFDNGDRSVYRS
ncbi:uncharacterized protein HMPREF1541_05983 [Cyphellophora europaea CBS 101466]|uniref:Uncharacterized protein n=1 Tax=Cyphellophora europaea (strain CBS 101466) TaxID=1220924 RepID=W2RTH9_CYPE1|nr:uncharacterized protein HMPREF1541_05983 [Cyphellophora europaea CBS 101466]ETN39757.1 hypothetical protein HMPREF1541_05983 [Cyphellophora europaea CBS 101466]